MLAKTEINTGRQIEFDYMKGLFTPMILLIHAFQMLGALQLRFPPTRLPILLLP